MPKTTTPLRQPRFPAFSGPLTLGLAALAFVAGAHAADDARLPPAPKVFEERLPPAPRDIALPPAGAPASPLQPSTTNLPPAPRDVGLPKQTLLVGPGRFYALPSEAARVAGDGDTVRIEPGTYEDCAVWRANGLTISPSRPGGAIVIRGEVCQGKGLWVISGDDVSVAGVTFTGARSDSLNGAGIRHEGANLTLRNTRFTGNEMGVLTTANAASTLIIEDSLFERNGIKVYEERIGHAVYAGAIRRLIVRRSVFREHYIGHHVKSRARATEVADSTIEDGPRGTASYLIDAPNGGLLTVRGNVLEKGPRTDNRSTAISIGAEGALHPASDATIANNRFRNDVGAPVIFVRNGAQGRAIVSGNSFTGPVLPLTGAGEVF